MHTFYMPTRLLENPPRTRTTTCYFNMARMNLGQGTKKTKRRMVGFMVGGEPWRAGFGV